MSIKEKETVAGLRLLAAVAKADGAPSIEGRSILQESLEAATLPAGVTAESLLGGSHDVEALAKEVTSQEGRDAAFSACVTMAYADRECVPAEQAVLDTIAKEWAVPKERKALLGRILSEARDTLWFSRVPANADPKLREASVSGDILKYSVISGVLGLNPVPVVSLATDIAVVGLQAKMFSDIGRHWGHETTKDTARQVLAGVGVGTGMRLATNGLMKFVPGVGSLFAASTNFASTWALGQVSNQYWESGGRADLRMLHEVFVKSRADGARVFETNRGAVEAKRKLHEKTLQQLSDDCAAGRMTPGEYAKQVAELR